MQGKREPDKENGGEVIKFSFNMIMSIQGAHTCAHTGIGLSDIFWNL